MFKVKWGVAVLTVIIFLGCQAQKGVESRGEYQGFTIIVHLYKGSLISGDLSSAATAGMKEARRRLELVLGEKGLISQLNKNRYLTDQTTEVVQLLELASRIHKASQGYYDYRGGRIESLWREAALRGLEPEDDTLLLECDRALATQWTVENSEVKLKGVGDLSLGKLALGWAVDGAFEVISRLGTTSGWADIEGVRRMWGKSPQGEDWEIRFPDTALDTLEFRLLLPPGGWGLVHNRIHKWEINEGNMVPVWNPFSGKPEASLEAVGVWGPTAAEAAAMAQAFWIMGRKGALEWVANRNEFGLVVLYGKGWDRVAETDLNLSERITIEYTKP